MKQYLFPFFFGLGVMGGGALAVLGVLEGITFVKALCLKDFQTEHLVKSLFCLTGAVLNYIICFWVGSFLSGDIDKGFTKK